MGQTGFEERMEAVVEMREMEQFTNSWLSHRTVLDQLLERVKDEDLGFQPWDDAMTLMYLVFHILQVGERFANAVKTGEFAPSATFEANSVRQIREMVKASTERTKAVLKSLTEADLEKQIGDRGPGRGILNMLKDHEIHHKGQLFVYVRMVGAKDMPSFINRSV